MMARDVNVALPKREPIRRGQWVRISIMVRSKTRYVLYPTVLKRLGTDLIVGGVDLL